MTKLSDFSNDQLQWMLNKACESIIDINYYLEKVEATDMENLMSEEIDKKIVQHSELVDICQKVKEEIGDRAVYNSKKHEGSI